MHISSRNSSNFLIRAAGLRQIEKSSKPGQILSEKSTPEKRRADSGWSSGRPDFWASRLTGPHARRPERSTNPPGGRVHQIRPPRACIISTFDFGHDRLNVILAENVARRREAFLEIFPIAIGEIQKFLRPFQSVFHQLGSAALERFRKTAAMPNVKKCR